MGARRNFRRGGGQDQKTHHEAPPNEKNVAKRPPISQKKIHDFPGGGGRRPYLVPTARAPCCVIMQHTPKCVENYHDH